MGFQVRVGGMAGAGDEITVPDYPFLETYTQRQGELKRSIADAETRTRQIQQQAHACDRLTAEGGDLGALETASAERASLKREYDQLYTQQKNLEHQLEQSQSEMREWIENFAMWIFQRRALARELATAPEVGDAPGTIRTYSVGESPRVRGRAELVEELLMIVAKLAHWSGEPKLATEWSAMKKQFSDSLPYITLTTNYVRLGTGEIITQAEFQERACKFGADAVSRGATSGGYVKGARVERAEAAKLGLV